MGIDDEREQEELSDDEIVDRLVEEKAEKKFPLRANSKPLRLFAFVLSDNPKLLDEGPDHLELIYGYKIEAVMRDIQKKYGPTMDDLYIKPMGSLEASELVKPILDDVYSAQLSSTQRKLSTLERKIPAVKKDNFVFNLKYMLDRLKTELNATDKRVIAKAIGKLEKSLKK